MCLKSTSAESVPVGKSTKIFQSYIEFSCKQFCISQYIEKILLQVASGSKSSPHFDILKFVFGFYILTIFKEK